MISEKLDQPLIGATVVSSQLDSEISSANGQDVSSLDEEEKVEI